MKETTAKLMAVLGALAESERGFMPASYVYLAVGSDMQAYEQVTSMLRAIGAAKVTAETIKLTPKGRSLGNRINAELAAKGSA